MNRINIAISLLYLIKILSYSCKRKLLLECRSEGTSRIQSIKFPYDPNRNKRPQYIFKMATFTARIKKMGPNLQFQYLYCKNPT